MCTYSILHMYNSIYKCKYVNTFDLYTCLDTSVYTDLCSSLILKITANKRHHTATRRALMKFPVTCYFQIHIMSVLNRYLVILRSFDSPSTMPTFSRMFRCYHIRSAPPRLGAAFTCRPLNATARTGLLSSHDRRCFGISSAADRRDARFSCYRELSTSSRNRNDGVGKIQSPHYHLVYTCKVPICCVLRLHFRCFGNL